MGKRSAGKFAPSPRDFYPTPAAAVLPLIPYLHRDHIKTFSEPCAGVGHLIRHLESFGFRGVQASDLAEGKNALTLTRADLNGAHAAITNPPFSRSSQKLLISMIEHFQPLAPRVWLLLPSDFASNQWFAPLLRSCTDIVPIGHLQWIPDSDGPGMDNYSWYGFDARHTGGPISRGNGEPPALPTCRQCRQPYAPLRATARFCSNACRQKAHRDRISVTLSVTANELLQPGEMGGGYDDRLPVPS